MTPMAVVVVVGALLAAVAGLLMLFKLGLGLVKLLVAVALLAVAWLGAYAGLRAYAVLDLDRREHHITARSLDGWAGRALELGFAPCIAGELLVRGWGERAEDVREELRDR